jgi:hypothetical protein
MKYYKDTFGPFHGYVAYRAIHIRIKIRTVVVKKVIKSEQPSFKSFRTIFHSSIRQFLSIRGNFHWGSIGMIIHLQKKGGRLASLQGISKRIETENLR